MCIHSTNNPATVHPDRIWNEYDGALGFFVSGRPSKKKNKMSKQYGIRSVIRK